MSGSYLDLKLIQVSVCNTLDEYVTCHSKMAFFKQILLNTNFGNIKSLLTKK